MLVDGGAIGHGLVTHQLFFGRGHTGLRGGQRAFAIGQLRLCVFEFFLTDRAIADQRLAPVQVVGGAGDVGLRLGHVRLAQGDLRAQAAVVGVKRAHLPHCLGQVGTRLVQCHFGIGRVELDQHLTGFHKVGVVGQDRHHGAANLRGDLDHIALHIGVVSRLVVAGYQPFIGGPAETGDDDDAGQRDERFFALGVAGSWRRGGACRSGHGARDSNK